MVRRRQRWIGITTAVMLLLAGAAGTGSQHQASAATPSKKHCKMVTKKVHGKKKKVKVCTTVKPKPTPTSAPKPTPGTPNPLSVTVHPDASRSVSATIGPEGGTLTAKDSHGTQFTLALPKNAVLTSTTITMTPVSSIDGLPLSKGLLGAVQFAPDGATFAQPLVLTIASSQSLNGGMPLAFGYHGSGSEFHLQPSTASGTTVTIKLWHFSGAGAGSGTQADVTSQMQHPPTSSQDEADQAAAAAQTDQERTDAAQSYYKSILRPQLIAAGSDDSQARPALQNYAQWRGRIATENIQQYLSPELQEAAGLAEAVFDHKLSVLAGQCGHQGVYYLAPGTVPGGADGWVNDQDHATFFIDWYIEGTGYLGRPDAAIALDDTARSLFAPCRVNGFKFEATTFTQVDGDVTITDTYSGNVCASTPFTTWTINVSRSVTDPEGTQTASGAKSITIPSTGSGTIFTGSDGSGAQVAIVTSSPAQVRLTEQPNRGFVLDHTQLDVSLDEDRSC